MSKPIVVIGSINMDLVTRTAQRPAPGETVLGRDFATVHGGKGANQAVAAARLGAEVHLIGRVGRDPFGRSLLAGLRDNGVHTGHVSISTGASSGVAVIVVDESGENSIIVIPGANALLTPADVDAASAIIAGAECVLFQLESPFETIAHAIELCRRLGVRTMLDPAPAPAQPMPPAFHSVDLLTPNQSEARAILALKPGELSDEAVGQQLLQRGFQTVILKLGGNGAMLLDRNAPAALVKSFAVTVADTTAAGDAFNAGLAVGLSEQMQWPAAIAFANAAGALACTKPGAQPSLATRAAVEALLANGV